MADSPTSALGQVEAAWHNLMLRLAIYGPARVQQAAMHLDTVDRITGITSVRKPPVPGAPS